MLAVGFPYFFNDGIFHRYSPINSSGEHIRGHGINNLLHKNLSFFDFISGW
jgi:hypothetical protein